MGIAKTGRPSPYKPEFVAEVEAFCREGAIDTDIADHFGVHVDTIYEWKKAHPEFSEAIKRGKAKPDREVAGRLIDRAMGAEWTEQQAIKLKRTEYKDGKKVLEEEYVEIVEVKRAAPPDTQAITYFLGNRRSDLWRNRQDVQHSSDPTNPMPSTVVYLPQNGRETKLVDAPAKLPQHSVKKRVSK